MHRGPASATAAPDSQRTAGDGAPSVVETVRGAVLFGCGAAATILLLLAAGRVLDVLTAPGAPLADASWVAVAVWWALVGCAALLAWRHWASRRHADPSDADEDMDMDMDTVAGREPDRQHWPATALVLALTALVLIGVAPWHWSGEWIGSIDTKYYGWLGWRLSRLTRPTLHLDGVVHPGGLDLLLLDGLGPITAIGVSMRVFGRWLGYDLVVFCGLVANGLAACRLARVVGARRSPAVWCGMAYLASPVFVGPLGSFPSLLWAAAPPLMIAEAIGAARSGRIRWWRIAALFVGGYLCSIYHLVFGALAAAIVALAWPGSHWRRRTAVAPVAAGLAAALLVLSPFLVARMRYVTEERAAGATEAQMLDDTLTFSADALDPLALPPDSRVLGSSLRWGVDTRPLERFRTAGLGLLLVAGVALAAVRPRRRVAGRAALYGAFGTIWLLSLGPRLTVASSAVGPRPGRGEWLPYRALVAVPGLSALRAPYRATIALAALGVALLAVALRHSGRARQAMVAVPLLTLSWWPPTETSAVRPPQALLDAMTAMDADDPGRTGAVLVIPFTCGFDDLDVMNWQPTHGRPMVVCGVSQSATRWHTRLATWFDTEAFAAVACDPTRTVLGGRSRFTSDTRLDAAGLVQLREVLGVRWLVYDTARESGCETAPEMRSTLAVLPTVADDGRYLVYDLAGAQP